MRKLMSFALCIAAVGSMSAQKANVEAAKKLSGKPEQIEEARNLIQQAMQNPETANDVMTYYIAGKVEFDAFDKEFAGAMINPQAGDWNKMNQELINGYNYFIKALPLDSVPNEKGKVNPKNSKDMIAKIAGHANDYFKAGADFFNGGKYYPEAYEGFMIFADMPDQPFMQSAKVQLPAEDRGTAYFNAGLAAYQGKEVLKSADAFRKARNVGYEDKQAYIYEIACWQTLAQQDSTMDETSKNKIMDIAEAGYKKFGVEEPIFINNLVNFMVTDENYAKALSTVDELLAQNPDNAGLYGLRGFVNDRKGDDAASVADYRKAVALEGCDYETLKNAAKKIFRVGTEKYNNIEGNSAEDRAAREDVRTNYFQVAKDITEKAKPMSNGDPDLEYVIENVDYVLSL